MTEASVITKVNIILHILGVDNVRFCMINHNL